MPSARFSCQRKFPFQCHKLPVCLPVCVCVGACVCVGQPLFGICSALLCPAGGRLSMTSCIIMSSNSLRYRVPSPSASPTCRDLLRHSAFGAYESFRPNAFCHSSLDLLHDISLSLCLTEHIHMSQILPEATAARPLLLWSNCSCCLLCI